MSQITCIIPFYNGGETIERAINSVIDAPELAELIIMNDASPQPLEPHLTDAHRAAISNGKMRVIEMSTNLGQAAMRNIAVGLSDAPYIAMMDQDDMFLPHFCREMSDVLNQHPDLAAIECGTEIVKNGVNLLELNDPRYIAICASVPWNILLRRNAFWQIGAFPTSAAFRTPLAGEDIAFKNALRYYLKTAADYSRQLLRHHLRDGSATDNYLNRTVLVDGQVTYTSHYENENNGDWNNALQNHFGRVQRDIEAFKRITPLN